MTFDPLIHGDHLIGQYYIQDDTNTKYKLLGIILMKEDWYWVLSTDNYLCDSKLLSCVCNIESFGYSKEEK